MNSSENDEDGEAWVLSQEEVEEEEEEEEEKDYEEEEEEEEKDNDGVRFHHSQQQQQGEQQQRAIPEMPNWIFYKVKPPVHTSGSPLLELDPDGETIMKVHLTRKAVLNKCGKFAHEKIKRAATNFETEFVFGNPKNCCWEMLERNSY